MTANQRHPLGSPSFLCYFSSRTISLLGDTIHYIALMSLIYQQTRSPLLLGGALVTIQSSQIIFDLFSGIAADRWNRKWTMIACDAYRAAAVIAIPFVLPSTGLLFLLLFSMACAESFYNLARASLLPDLLQGEQQLVQANSLLQAATTIVMIAGPLLAAAVVVNYGTTAAFLLDGGSFLLAGLLIMPLKDRQARIVRIKDGIFKELADGYRYFVRQPQIVGIAITTSLLLSAMFLPMSLKIVFADQFIAGQGFDATSVLGYLSTASGLGGLLGAALLPKLTRHQAVWKMIVLGAVCASIELFCFSVASDLSLLLAATLLSGCAFSLVNVPATSLLQLSATDEMRGKVLALYSVLLSGITTLAVLAGGFAGTAIGLRPVYLMAGLLCLAAGYAAFMLLRHQPAATYPSPCNTNTPQ
jgi:predicted MFS family arabinose efflux permease